MPTALVELLAVLGLAVMLVVAFLHPPGRVEAAVGVGAAAMVVAVGALDIDQAEAQVRKLLPVVGFLAAILVVAEMCAREGLFDAVGARIAGAGRRRPGRMLLLAFLIAAVTTTVLSLDATVVLLTPVLAASAAAAVVSARPMEFAGVRMANSASLLFPVSNLTNLLALPELHLSFLGFAARTAPAWLAVILVEYVGHRIVFASDLQTSDVEPVPVTPVAVPVVPLAVVAAMLAGFAALSPFGVPPAWVAGGAALALAARAVAGRRATSREVLASAHIGFAVFVLCLGVVVGGVTQTFLGRVVHHLVPGARASAGLLGLLGIAALATVLANVLNNLPATLLLLPFVAPLGVTPVLAALVGLNVGSGLTWTGSLANLLWRRVLARHGRMVSTRAFHAVSVPLTLPAVAVGVVVIWAWPGALR